MAFQPGVADLAVGLVGLLACVYDVALRRIPNLLTFGAALVAIAYHGAADGFGGIAFSAAGWTVGLALMFPWFALGGMGAGDVKLLAAFGAWLGPANAAWTALAAALVGGGLGVVVALGHGKLRQVLFNLARLLQYWSVAGPRPMPDLTLEASSGPRLAYAIPLTAGALVTVWLR